MAYRSLFSRAQNGTWVKQQDDDLETESDACGTLTYSASVSGQTAVIGSQSHRNIETGTVGVFGPFTTPAPVPAPAPASVPTTTPKPTGLSNSIPVATKQPTTCLKVQDQHELLAFSPVVALDVDLSLVSYLISNNYSTVGHT